MNMKKRGEREIIKSSGNINVYWNEQKDLSGEKDRKRSFKLKFRPRGRLFFGRAARFFRFVNVSLSPVIIQRFDARDFSQHDSTTLGRRRRWQLGSLPRRRRKERNRRVEEWEDACPRMSWRLRGQGGKKPFLRNLKVLMTSQLRDSQYSLRSLTFSTGTLVRCTPHFWLSFPSSCSHFFLIYHFSTSFFQFAERANVLLIQSLVWQLHAGISYLSAGLVDIDLFPLSSLIVETSFFALSY